jgi:hypothetical protein
MFNTHTTVIRDPATGQWSSPIRITARPAPQPIPQAPSQSMPAARLNVASAVALAQAERTYKRKRFGFFSGALHLGLSTIPAVCALFVLGIFFWPCWFLMLLVIIMHFGARNDHKDAKYILRAARRAAR